MALLVNNLGEIEMLARILGEHRTVAGDSVRLRLYDNDVTPAEGDTWGTYIESSGTGYAAIYLNGDSWTTTTGAGDTTTSSYAQQTFTYSAGDTLYGYYVTSFTETGDSVCMWSERFTDGPYTIPSGGGTVKVTPRISLD